MGDGIRLLAIDPSLTNIGLAKMLVAHDGSILGIEDMCLVKTEKEKGKVVRRSSDDLRRSVILWEELYAWAVWSDIMAAEIPSGGKSARTAFAFGVVTGLLAAVSTVRPLIQVNPSEVKRGVTGRTTASKDEMIAWAAKTFPDAPWKTRKLRGQLVMTDDNEHMADACAAGVAATKTQQFRAAAEMSKRLVRA